MPTNLLALDTSGSACSVFLLQTDSSNTPHRHFSAGGIARQHTQQILHQIQQLLTEAGLRLSDLNALAFASGPGSFTGLRLAASVIQGLAWGAGLPVIAVPTLQAIAEGAYQEQGAEHVLVAVNAYGGKMYWGGYQRMEGQMQAILPDRLCLPEEASLPLSQGSFIGVGDAWEVYKEPLLSLNIATTYPLQTCNAKYIAHLALTQFASGQVVPATAALPTYLYGAENWRTSGSAGSLPAKKAV